MQILSLLIVLNRVLIRRSIKQALLRRLSLIYRHVCLHGLCC